MKTGETVRPSFLSATELAKTGKCEQQLYYDCCYGDDHKYTKEQIRRGNQAHQAFADRITGRNSSFLARLWRGFCRWLGLGNS